MSKNHRHVPYEVAYREVTGRDISQNPTVYSVSHEDFLNHNIGPFDADIYYHVSKSSTTFIGTVHLLQMSNHHRDDSGFVLKESSDRNRGVDRNKFMVIKEGDISRSYDENGDIDGVHVLPVSSEDAIDVLIRSGVVDDDLIMDGSLMIDGNRMLINDGEYSYHIRVGYGYDYGAHRVFSIRVTRFNYADVKIVAYDVDDHDTTAAEDIEIASRAFGGYRSPSAKDAAGAKKRAIRSSTRIELKDMAAEYNTYGDIEDDDLSVINENTDYF